MKKLTDKLFRDFRRIDGARFKGAMVDSPLSLAQNGSYPPRLMIIKNPCFIKAGDMIKNEEGEIFLMLQYPTIRAGGQTFRAIQATDTFTWERRVDAIDPVSGMAKSSGITDLGPLYGTFQNLKGHDFEGFDMSRKTFWTGQLVLPGDLVDDKPVIKVEESMGARLVTIR